jgi:hypothetical protein
MGFVLPLPDDDNVPLNSTENLEGDIFAHAVERVLPNLPKRFGHPCLSIPLPRNHVL